MPLFCYAPVGGRKHYKKVRLCGVRPQNGKNLVIEEAVRLGEYSEVFAGGDDVGLEDTGSEQKNYFISGEMLPKHGIKGKE